MIDHQSIASTFSLTASPVLQLLSDPLHARFSRVSFLAHIDGLMQYDMNLGGFAHQALFLVLYAFYLGLTSGIPSQHELRQH
jgi:hypothetical protein